MSKRVAIVQSSYIPWRGTFGMIALCDTLVFLDSVQFTRRDWRSRNRIKTPSGPAWLSIPTRQRGNRFAPIDAIRIADPTWAKRHLRRLELTYRAAPAFAQLFPTLRDAYLSVSAEAFLSTVNQRLTAAVCAILGIKTTLLSDIQLIPRETLDAATATDRLVALACISGADTYVSGPSARSYLEVKRFRRAGIEVAWTDYSGLGEYPQLWGPFTSEISILDTLLNLGAEGTRHTLEAVRLRAGHESTSDP